MQPCDPATECHADAGLLTDLYIGRYYGGAVHKVAARQLLINALDPTNDSRVVPQIP